jgi:hypothetical protein
MNSLNLLLSTPEQTRKTLQEVFFPFLKTELIEGKKWVLSLKPETRSQAQNRLMWPILECFSKQLEWPVNGRMVKMEPEEWKDVLSAAFRDEYVRIAMGLTGGVVLLGQRTSRFTKPEFAAWVDFLYATATDRGVKLPAWNWDES